MRIGDLARRHGLRTSAIRYYEAIGVLPAPPRVSGRRAYGADAASALRLLRALQVAGFTLAEIRRLGPLVGGTAAPEAWRPAVRAKLRELDAGIASLQAARAALAGSLRCACAGRADACRLVARTEPPAEARVRERGASPRRAAAGRSRRLR